MYLRFSLVLLTLCLMQKICISTADFLDNLFSVYKPEPEPEPVFKNLTHLSGNWYEAARAPNQTVLECLNVLVDSVSVEKDLILYLKYKVSVNGQWQYSAKVVSVPLDSMSSYGYFTLTNTNRYILHTLDFTRYAIILEYFPPFTYRLFKIFTRQREVTSELKKYKQDTVDQIKLEGPSQISWTEQSPDKCNSGMRHGNFISLSFLLTLFALMWSKI